MINDGFLGLSVVAIGYDYLDPDRSHFRPRGTVKAALTKK